MQLFQKFGTIENFDKKWFQSIEYTLSEFR